MRQDNDSGGLLKINLLIPQICALDKVKSLDGRKRVTGMPAFAFDRENTLHVQMMKSKWFVISLVSFKIYLIFDRKIIFHTVL